MLEYLFPPFPGDTVMLFGGVLAVRGEKPWFWVFAAITAGSLMGAAVDYWVGLKVAQLFERHPERERIWGFSRTALFKMDEKMRRFGAWLIAGNRFLPGIRSLLFVAAGTAGLPFRRVMLLGAASTLAWNALLMGVGTAVGGNAEKLEALVLRYQSMVQLLLIGLGAALVVRFLWRRVVSRRVA
jgi:membrane protein DedA with SNARE-associated domain